MTASTMMKVFASSESTEWYTPRPYVDAAREVMGSIDCDPASDDIPQQVVKAAVYYTKETNGLTKRWEGNVWLNPPYGFDGKRGNQSRWGQRLIEQYQAGITKQAVLLVNAKTSERWFQPLYAYPICFTHHRIHFYNPGRLSGQPSVGSALVYLGPNVERFVQVFRQFGRVVRTVDIPTAGLWAHGGAL
jgi:hypothetical protein